MNAFDQAMGAAAVLGALSFWFGHIGSSFVATFLWELRAMRRWRRRQGRIARREAVRHG